MSVKISAIVWARQFKTHSDKLVALKLADVAGDDGAHVYPAVKTVAAECQLHEKSVRRAIAKLRKAGVLRLIARGSNQGPDDDGVPRGQRRHNEYAFDMNALLAMPISGGEIVKNNLKDEEKTVDTQSTVFRRRGAQDSTTVDTQSTAHIIQDIEPSKNQARAERVFLCFEDFESKWPWYSHESRTAAKRAWDNLAAKDHAEALAGIGKYIASKHPGGKRKPAGYYLSERVWLNRSAPTLKRSVFTVKGSRAWHYAVSKRNLERGLDKDAYFSVTVDTNHPESGNSVKGFEWRIGWFTDPDLPPDVSAEKGSEWWIIERPVMG